jgi:choline dehydrogenase-like flavoprotein
VTSFSFVFIFGAGAGAAGAGSGALTTFRPDGAQLAAALLGGTIALWDTKRGVQVGSLDVRRDAGGGRRAGDLLPASAAAEGAHFPALAYAPDGEALLAGGRTKWVCLYAPTHGILLRSNAPDPHQRVGRSTYLHLVNFSAAQFEQVINPFYGAPQSVYSDHFQWDDGTSGRLCYKLEVPPLQPALTATLLGDFGRENALRMAQLPHTNVMLALLRDGFHEDSAEGCVELRGDGSPVLDYQMTDYTWDGVRRAYLTMAEIQFAAGAKAVMPTHADARYVGSWKEARDMIENLDLALYRTRLGSAHVMGGCAMGEDAQQAVVDSLGRHHHLANLSIHDGSLFPTSIGANPQLSIYGLTAKLATLLAERLKSPS